MLKTTHELLKNLTIFHENSSRTLTNTLKRQNAAGISLPSIASKKNSKTGTYDFRDIRRVTAYAFGKRNYWRNRSGHQPCWRLRVNNDFSTCPPDKSTPQALFEVNDWLSIHFKEVGHRVVYKVAFDKKLFCHHRRCNQKWRPDWCKNTEAVTMRLPFSLGCLLCGTFED